MKSLFDYLILLVIFSLVFFSCDSKENPGTVSNATYYSSGPQNGHLLIAGGNLTDTSVFKRFMDLAGGSEAPIVIVSTARTDEDLVEADFYANQRKRFEGYGFKNIAFLHTRNRDTANSMEFVNSINRASGVWFLGGRQWRLVDAYSETATLTAFNNLLKRGGVIGGSSAGASIQADYLVRGDTKTNTVMMGDHEQGFGFLRNVAIDQHLLAMNRQFDIFEILDVHPELLGLGLDENTAIVVSGDEFEVVGESYVAVYDGTFYREIRDKDDWSQVIGEITLLPAGSRKFYVLKSGQRYDIKNRKVVLH